MRHLKSISFFIYSFLLFFAGFLSHRLPEASFGSVPETQKEAVPALEQEHRLTCDTAFVVRCVNLSTRECTEQYERLPEKYTGLNREDFVRCIADAMASQPLSEREKGLCSMEVISFSPQKIVLQKCYDKKTVSSSYFLAVIQNRVIVYEQDRSTIFLETNQDARLLPDGVRTALLQGQVIESREALEKFLVSYCRS